MMAKAERIEHSMVSIGDVSELPLELTELKAVVEVLLDVEAGIYSSV